MLRPKRPGCHLIFAQVPLEIPAPVLPCGLERLPVFRPPERSLAYVGKHFAGLYK